MRIDRFFTFLILLLVLFGFLNGFVYIRLGKIRGRSDGDVLALARAEVLCGNVHDAVSVDIERNLDLRNSARSGRNAGKLETTERFVIFREFSFAL